MICLTERLSERASPDCCPVCERPDKDGCSCANDPALLIPVWADDPLAELPSC